MSGQCAWDIETIASPRAAELFAHKIYEPSSTLSSIDNPPSSITRLKNEDLKAERLQEWKETQSAKLEADVIKQKKRDLDNSALYWWSGQVVCISLKPLIIHADDITFHGKNEREILTKLDQWLQDNPGIMDLVGMSDFDRPYIIGRCLANKVRVPSIFKNKWHINGNVDRLFSPAGSCGQTSNLSNYAFGIGMHKTGSGSDVAELYDSGEWIDLIDYCENDTEIVREMLRRYNASSSTL